MKKIVVFFCFALLNSSLCILGIQGNSIGVNKKDIESFNPLKDETISLDNFERLEPKESDHLFSPELELPDGRDKREVGYEDESAWFPSLMVKIKALTAALKQAFKSDNPGARKKIKVYENNPYYVPKDAITFDFDREAFKAGKEYDKSGFIKPPHFDLHPSF